MSLVPTQSEREKLDRVSKAGQLHFAALVVLICIGGISFLVPKDIAPVMAVVVGALICVVGLSTFRLQHFQKCPRCSAKKNRSQGWCGSCGLHYYATKLNEDGK